MQTRSVGDAEAYKFRRRWRALARTYVRWRSAGLSKLALVKLSRMVLCLAALWLHPTHAQEYEWIDQRGVVNRSTTLPPDPRSFRELRVIEGSEKMSALERRTLDIINQEAHALHPAPVFPQSSHLAVGAFEAPSPSVSIAEPSRGTENVRDPCLLSWDPQCHEKHADDYDPRWGYAPSVVRGATGDAQHDANAP